MEKPWRIFLSAFRKINVFQYFNALFIHVYMVNINTIGPVDRDYLTVIAILISKQTNNFIDEQT